MKLFFIVTFLMTSLMACSQNTKQRSLGKEFVDEYLDRKMKFPQEYVSHFPSQIEFPANYVFQEGSENNNPGLFLDQKNDNLDSLRSYLTRKAVAKYSAADSCLVVVNRYLRIDDYGIANDYRSRMARSKLCEENYFPVANFWSRNAKKFETSCRLSRDYDLYVLDAKPGIYLDDLHRNSGRWMPEDWKHGYSKGIAVSQNEKSVIYWLVIW